MWMLEDMDNMRAMLDAVKKLNLDDVNSVRTLCFIPAHLEEIYRDEKAVYVNFFKIFIDPASGETKFAGVPFEEYVRRAVMS